MKIKLNSDERINLLLIVFISYTVWVISLNNIIDLSVFGRGLATYICILLYAAIIVCALPAIWKRLNYTDFLVLIAIVVVLISSYLLFPDTHNRMSNKVIYFFQALPWLFVGRCVMDYRSFLSLFEKVANVTIILGALYYILRIVKVYENGYNNMDFAYKYLPSCIIAVYGLAKNVNIKNIVFTIVSASVLVLCGCRGALLCYCVAVLIFVYFFVGKRWYKIAATLIFAAAALLFIKGNLYLMMISLYKRLQALGVDSRIFRQILTDEFSDSSGRNIIAKQVFSGIAERPFFGYGLYGDTTLNSFGTYSHNIILELMASFGVPIGIALFLAFIVSFFRIITSKRYPVEYKIILITFFCVGFVKLFISSSFTQEAYFYLLIGMLAANKKEMAQVDKKYLFYKSQIEMTA